MTYSTTITRKGQITIPKALRDMLKLQTSKKVFLEIDKNRRVIQIKQHPDILDLAGMFKPRKRISVLKAREYMEKHYERI